MRPKLPKLELGGIYFMTEKGPRRIAIKGFLQGYPVRLPDKKTYVYVSTEAVHRLLKA